MANTQINITTNGTTILDTVGKYCDKNIDVNVNVPATGITPSGSKTITTNGTHDVTNYANAIVDVQVAQPTQFTNLYDPANVMVQKSVDASSSGITYNDDKYCNAIKVPYYHKANEPVVMRIRGIGTIRDRMGCGTLAADGETRVNHYQFNSTTYFTVSYDEYGDTVVAFKGNPASTEWYYFVFAFQYIGINSSVTTPYTGPIITINEPIGNGGHIG